MKLKIGQRWLFKSNIEEIIIAIMIPPNNILPFPTGPVVASIKGNKKEGQTTYWSIEDNLNSIQKTVNGCWFYLRNQDAPYIC